jgi:hypothetical protein
MREVTRGGNGGGLSSVGLANVVNAVKEESDREDGDRDGRGRKFASEENVLGSMFLWRKRLHRRR